MYKVKVVMKNTIPIINFNAEYRLEGNLNDPLNGINYQLLNQGSSTLLSDTCF